MNLRFIDWIWHIRGSVLLPPGQSGDEAFDRLAPMFRQGGTTHERGGGTLTFIKKDQAAQDKMAIFDRGWLRIEQAPDGLMLRYHLTSRALLFCFLAPLLFLVMAQLTIAVNRLEKPVAEKPEPKKVDPPMNPIDKFLGAPAPDKPDDKKKAHAKDKKGGRDKKPSPAPAYVFAGIFAALYVGGRILEDRLIRWRFGKRLSGAAEARAGALPFPSG